MNLLNTMDEFAIDYTNSLIKSMSCINVSPDPFPIRIPRTNKSFSIIQSLVNMELNIVFGLAQMWHELIQQWGDVSFDR